MAHDDTWDEFIAKLANSKNGRLHGSFVAMQEELAKEAEARRRPVPTNPDTRGDL